MEKLFANLASKISRLTGKPWVFLLAVLSVLIWAITGPLFQFSDTWQLVINTSTTIITFLMVFLIQNTQNRDNMALHAKLDELIEATEGARNVLERVEDKTETEIQELRS